MPNWRNNNRAIPPPRKNLEEPLTLSVLVLVLRVHDVRAADGVADEGEEAHGESEEDGGERGVAPPHGLQVRPGLVVGAVQPGNTHSTQQRMEEGEAPVMFRVEVMYTRKTPANNIYDVRAGTKNSTVAQETAWAFQDFSVLFLRLTLA